MQGYYKCDCGNEVLHIEEDTIQLDDDKIVVYLNIAIWLQGYNNNHPSWQDRLRHCWQILRTGKNYADQIILNWDEMNRLHNDLEEIVKSHSSTEES